MVELTIDGSKKTLGVARLVYSHFADDFDSNRIVKHRDGDKENNCIENLYQEPPVYPHRGWRLWPPAMPIIVRETGVQYKNARRAAEAIGGMPASIHKCLRGELKTHRGYTFEYGENPIKYNDRKFDNV